MADSVTRGMIPLDLDKPRLLWYNFTAMKELKEKHNIKAANFEKTLADADGDLNYDNIAILLAYGLRHEDKTITAEWVCENIGMVELVKYLPKIQAAFGVGSAESVAPGKAVN